MATIRQIPSKELTSEILADWRELASDERYLHSPFFQPEYTQAVAAVRDDVEVALLYDADQLQAVFPFQRTDGGLARNVCSRLSEFHGPVTRLGFHMDVAAVLPQLGLRYWQFDHLPLPAPSVTTHVWGESTSPFIDLSDGFEAWLALKKAQKSSSITQTLRKARKAARELGPLRFEYQSHDLSAFEALLRWKDAQHQRTGRLRVLQYDWLIRLLKMLVQEQDQQSLGLFSTLHAGDQLLAVHLGLRTERVIHLWFPSYDSAFDRYSPGLILLMELLQQASEQGVRRFDLGKGKERYKASFKSGDIPLGEGAVDLRPFYGPLRKRWYQTKRRIRQSRFQKQFEWPFELTRSLRQRLAFD